MSNYQVGHPLITIWAWPAYKAGATHLDGAYVSWEILLHFATNCAKEATLILIYLGQCMVSEGYQRLQISLAHEMLRAASRQGVTVLQFDQGSKQTPVHSSEFGGGIPNLEDLRGVFCPSGSAAACSHLMTVSFGTFVVQMTVRRPMTQ